MTLKEKIIAKAMKEVCAIARENGVIYQTIIDVYNEHSYNGLEELLKYDAITVEEMITALALKGIN